MKQKLTETKEYLKVHAKVIDFILYKPRTEKEVFDKIDVYLKRVKNELLWDEIKEKVLEEVKLSRLIDDENYVDAYIDQKKRSKVPPGRRKVFKFLYKKGADKDLINAGMTVYSLDIERVGAEKSLERKAKSLKATPEKHTYKDIHKIKTFLYGRGYSSDAINAVVDTYFKVQ